MARTLEDFFNEALQTVREVTVQEAQRILEQGDHLVLDVREPDEYLYGRLPGATNVPRGWLEVKADLVHPKKDPILQDRSQKILCYCGGGYRSALAAKTLQEMGFENVVSMRGGWSEWISERLPIEK